MKLENLNINEIYLLDGIRLQCKKVFACCATFQQLTASGLRYIKRASTHSFTDYGVRLLRKDTIENLIKE